MMLAINHTEIGADCASTVVATKLGLCDVATVSLLIHWMGGLKALLFAKSAASKCEIFSYAGKGLDDSLVVECRLTFGHFPP